MKAEFQVTTKGFKVLPVTTGQIFHWGGLCICDSCGERIIKEGMYVPVLNSAYCNGCYEDWHKRAKRYEEDQWFEDRHVADMTLRLEDYAE